MKKNILILVISGMMITPLYSQIPELSGVAKSSVINSFDKKFYFGVSWNQYWGNIKGDDLPETYFAKPCIGYNLTAQYYPLSFLGIGVGGGFQQRGAGIITPDKSGGSFTHPWETPVGDPDSTYRRRLRYNALELPVTILIRSPRDIVKGVRVSAAAGFALIKPRVVQDFFYSVEDGFHISRNVTNEYSTKEIASQFSIGADIEAGGGCILQAHLVYTKGSRNVFAANQGNGRMETLGFRIAFLF